MKICARLVVVSREAMGTFVLSVLFAVFAFAVGLSGLGNVDL